MKTDALDLDALETDMMRGGAWPGSQPTVLALIARCRAAEQREAQARDALTKMGSAMDELVALCNRAEQRADNAEGVIREAMCEQGFVCGGCGEFWDGTKYGQPPRAGCRSSKEGLHRLYALIAVEEATFGPVAPRAEATPEHVLLTEDPTVGAIETAAGVRALRKRVPQSGDTQGTQAEAKHDEADGPCYSD